MQYELKVYRGRYCVYWRDDRGRPVRRSLGTADGAAAQRGFAEFKRLSELRERSGHRTIANLWDARRKALGGRRLAENMAYSGVALLPFFGSLTPLQVTKDIVAEYIAKRVGEGRAPGTIWTEVNHLRMTLTWAKKEGYLQDVPTFSLPPRPAPKTEYLTKEQVRELLSNTVHSHLHLFIVLACTTGARNRALLDLTWDRVDLTRNLINFSVPDEENRKGRAIVPINDTLRIALLKAFEEKTCDHCIEWNSSRVFSVKKALKRVSRTAGIPSVSPHIFRHSAAVWMAESGIPMEEIAQFLGHSDISVTRKVYARYSPSYLRSAAEALTL